MKNSVSKNNSSSNSFLLVSCLLFFSVSFAWSGNETEIGARAMGLSGAFTAMADDAHALYYNPAGLKTLRRKELAASYDLIHTGLRDESKISNAFVAYAHPFRQKAGAFGLAWNELSTRDLYKERAIILGYGRRVSGRLSLGVNVKYLSREFSVPSGQTDNSGFINTAKTDPIYNDGNSRSNIGADAGLLLDIGKKTTVGFMAVDINEPDMAISQKNRDIRPMLLRSGVAYRDRLLNIAGQINAVKSASELERNVLISGAAERWWFATRFTRADLAARGSLSVGPDNFSQMALGLSYRYGSVQIDYGFLMALQGVGFGSQKGSHQFTMSYRFGKNVTDTDFKNRFNSAETILMRALQKIEYYADESKKAERNLEDLKSRAVSRLQTLPRLRANGGDVGVHKFMLNEFEEEYSRYSIRKAAGATLADQALLLAEIIAEFGSGDYGSYNFEIAKKEIETIRSEKMAQEARLNSAWSGYMQLKAWGGTRPDRIDLLAEMADRFAGVGLDCSLVFEELQDLRKAKKPD